ncbi:MAG: ComF family protein [Anaerofustis stercorihominis]|nr:ComF family protein [Anaerofustis stercorihominis]
MKSLSFKANPLLQNTAINLKELLFPSFGTCPSCSRVLLHESFICEKCENGFEKPKYFCVKCKRVTIGKGICVSCATSDAYWDDAVCSFVYAYPADNIIHEMKYRNYPDIAEYLGKYLSKDFTEKCTTHDFDAITFVPSSEAKMLERGYNQAELLANTLGDALNIPVEGFLIDNGESVHQVGLSGSQRAENAKGRFSLADNADVRGKKIIVVDDVITTGSTMNSCSKALKEGGAIYILAASVTQTMSQVK